MFETQEVGHFFGSINRRRLQQPMVLSSAWEIFFFPDRKWIVFIFYIYTSFCRFRTMLLFYVEFLLNDSGRCCLRPKLSILYSMYPIMIIFINIYIIFKKMVCISNLLNQLLGFMNWFFYLTRRHPTCNNNSISGNIKGTYFSSLSLSLPVPLSGYSGRGNLFEGRRCLLFREI
jgi:hypothetical protein